MFAIPFSNVKSVHSLGAFSPSKLQAYFILFVISPELALFTIGSKTVTLTANETSAVGLFSGSKVIVGAVLSTPNLELVTVKVSVRPAKFRFQLYHRQPS